MSDGLKKGLKELCLQLPIDESYALNQLTVINIPENINDIDFRNKLLRNYLIEIGRGLGQFAGKVWRIGLMGESCVPQNVFAVLSAFEKLLIENKSFSFYKDFDQNTEDLSSNEQEFVEEIFDQIVLDIFNSSVANW